MDVIEITRKLGAAIQQDERYIRYAKAKLANDNDENLQKAIGEFNIARMNLENEVSNDNKNDEKIKELNEKLREIYGNIMSSSGMVEYNTAKAEVDSMLNEINGLISLCVEGEDPETCQVPHGCSGSCSTCGGCH
ncbi:MAG: YlbF family regulator [Clostridia bacterium]|nr:YlbF family regulator [Clostridia bacterium]